VVSAIKTSNGDVGGKIFEIATTEYYVRGRGYIKSLADIENVVLKVVDGTPVYVKNVGTVHLGGDLRRGVAELDGKGEVVGGIVVMRYGENALNVIDGVKRRWRKSKLRLPEGVRIVPTYDRSELIRNAIHTLREKADRGRVSSSRSCAWFSFGTSARRWWRSSRCPLRSSVLLPMMWLGLTSNIMSLGGIAIAIGAMVDAAIIMVENAHKALGTFPRGTRARPRPCRAYTGDCLARRKASADRSFSRYW
jgi:Cu(I)/Ag(I) efflux system membrane protein CusA/SilA